MGDFYDKTPKEAISKIMLEDKVPLRTFYCSFLCEYGSLIFFLFINVKFYSTWYHGRTVLLGDGETTATL